MGKWWRWSEQLPGLLGRGEASPAIAQALYLGDPIERSRSAGRALLCSIQESSHGAHQWRARAQAALAKAQWLIALSCIMASPPPKAIGGLASLKSSVDQDNWAQ
jgi:hypothetical protein